VEGVKNAHFKKKRRRASDPPGFLLAALRANEKSRCSEEAGPQRDNQARSDKPAPLALYIHGGGFRGGSKTSVNQRTLQELLAAGISVAAIEYRLVPEHPLPTAHRDSLRALQFIRSRAGRWNIDKKRIGAFGGSAGAQICMWLAFHDEMADPAGAQICMWLAFHDEMADPQSSDPLKRESSRLACVATNGGQTTMDIAWWKKWVPGYGEPHRGRVEVFGDVTDEELSRIVADISALSLVTKDDPPIFMSYGMAPMPRRRAIRPEHADGRSIT